VNTLYASAPATPLTQLNFAPSSTVNHHPLLGPRYSGGNPTSNVLMVPSSHHPRGGGSLPDLRTGEIFHHPPGYFSANPSTPTSAAVTQRFFRSSETSHNNHHNGDLSILVITRRETYSWQ
jgi:hypothetical protein